MFCENFYLSIVKHKSIKMDSKYPQNDLKNAYFFVEKQWIMLYSKDFRYCVFDILFFGKNVFFVENLAMCHIGI